MKPSRAIDFRPQLARAIDVLGALREDDVENVLKEIARRVDEWTSQRLGSRNCSRAMHDVLEADELEQRRV